MRRTSVGFVIVWLATASCRLAAEDPATSVDRHPLNTWVKRTPLDATPPSPRLGYEGACVWDNRNRVLIRYGGHNQGGGGEQGAEVWTFDPLRSSWKLMEPNTSPPGVCCNAQNLFATNVGLYLRFPLFSGSHGWQWQRELYLNDSSVWTYDLGKNRWRNMRPAPEPKLAPYRCASWDSDHQVAVVFGGEGGRAGTVVYDPWRNEWRWPRPDVEPESRSGGSMAYDASTKLHVLFGAQFTDDPHTWTYSVADNRWRSTQPETMPPTDKNDAVLTYDPHSKTVLAIVKQTQGKDEQAEHDVQSWSYNSRDNRWTRLNPEREPDAAGNRTRNLVFAPELNLAILENCTSKPREQQIWTYRRSASPQQLSGDAARAAAPDSPPLPVDLVVSVIDAGHVELSWQPPESAADSVIGYLVERAVVEVWSEDQLVRLKTRTPPLASPSVGAIRRVGPFRSLTSTPLQRTSFTDTDLDLTRPEPLRGEPALDHPLHESHLDKAGRGYRHGVFAYRIRSVRRDGKQSGPSPLVFTIPSSPQLVFSRERGEACDVKWEANPERGIAGYRVYRMDGRWTKDTISRLTAEPISTTAYTDEQAGSTARRYYVVAVDALGQEGLPSSPVWHQRTWKEFYAPFIGPWHQ